MEPLSVTTLILIFVVTFLTKTYGTIIGGASFILQPFLIAMGIPPHMAVAHDIAGTNGVTVTGGYVFFKSGHIDLRVALYTLPGVIIGPVIGVYFLNSTTPETLEKFIAVISFIGASYMLLKYNKVIGKVRAAPHPFLSRYRPYLGMLFGLVIGTYIGFSGAGGGILSGLLLISVMNLSVLQTIATKRFIHAPAFIISAGAYYYMGWLDPMLFFTVFTACLAAGFVGSHMSLRINEKILGYIFIAAAAIMALLILF